MEGDVERIELGHALVERLLEVEVELCGRGFQRLEIRQVALVALPEVQRIRKAGAHDLAIAMHDLLAAIGGLDVGDQDEMVGEHTLPLRGRVGPKGRGGVTHCSRCITPTRAFRATSPLKGEVGGLRANDKALLIGLDRQADDLGRDREIVLFKRAEQNLRPFDEAGDFLQQALVLDQFQPIGKGDIAGVVQDHVLAALGIEDDLGAFQIGDVVVEAADGDGIRRVEAVAIVTLEATMPSISKG